MNQETGIKAISNGIPKLIKDFKKLRAAHREHVLEQTLVFLLIPVYSLVLIIF